MAEGLGVLLIWNLQLLSMACVLAGTWQGWNKIMIIAMHGHHDHHHDDHHDDHDDLHWPLISLYLIRPSAGVARGAQRC